MTVKSQFSAFAKGTGSDHVLSGFSLVIRGEAFFFYNGKETRVIPQDIEIGIVGYKIEVMTGYIFFFHCPFEPVD